MFKEALILCINYYITSFSIRSGWLLIIGKLFELDFEFSFKINHVTILCMVTMITKAYMAALWFKFSIFEILSKIERYYRKRIGNTVLCDKNAKYWVENRSND